MPRGHAAAGERGWDAAGLARHDAARAARAEARRAARRRAREPRRVAPSTRTAPGIRSPPAIRARPRGRVMAAIQAIVEAEGPMRASRAYALYNRAAGGKKLTTIARAPLSSAAYWLAREGSSC